MLIIFKTVFEKVKIKNHMDLEQPAYALAPATASLEEMIEASSESICVH